LAKETNEKSYLLNSFVAGAFLICIPLAYGAMREYPKEYYVFHVPPLAGLLVIVYALENSIKHLRARIELLEEDSKMNPPASRPPGGQRPSPPLPFGGNRA
jgi:hypothetical protein